MAIFKRGFMIIKSEFANENYDEYELAVICYLSQFKKEKTQIYLSAKTILKDLIASTYTRCEYENICKAINKLIQKQILIQYNFDKEGVYVNFEKAYPSKNDFYFELTLKDILTILQSENKNKYLTLKVFATILSNFASNISVIVDNNTKKELSVRCHKIFLRGNQGVPR